MFGPRLFDLAYSDASFEVLVWSVVTLLVLALAFTAGAIALRLTREARRRSREQRRARWSDLYADVIAGERPLKDLLETVHPAEASDFLYLLSQQIHSAEGLHERDLCRALARPLLPSIRQAVKTPAAERRARAVRILGRLGEPAVVPLLVEALADPSPLVAITALQALVDRRATEAIGAIVEHLPRFRNWNRPALAALLSEMGLGTAPALRRVLLDGGAELRTRQIAAAVLEELGDPAAADAAAKLIERGAERELVMASLRLLGGTARTDHFPLLRRLTRSDDEVVRIRSISTLVRLDAADEELLQRALGDESRWVAIQAVRGLLRLGRHDLLESLAASGHERATLARQILSESLHAA